MVNVNFRPTPYVEITDIASASLTNHGIATLTNTYLFRASGSESRAATLNFTTEGGVVILAGKCTFFDNGSVTPVIYNLRLRRESVPDGDTTNMASNALLDTCRLTSVSSGDSRVGYVQAIAATATGVASLHVFHMSIQVESKADIISGHAIDFSLEGSEFRR